MSQDLRLEENIRFSLKMLTIEIRAVRANTAVLVERGHAAPAHLVAVAVATRVDHPVAQPLRLHLVVVKTLAQCGGFACGRLADGGGEAEDALDDLCW